MFWCCKSNVPSLLGRFVLEIAASNRGWCTIDFINWSILQVMICYECLIRGFHCCMFSSCGGFSDVKSSLGVLFESAGGSQWGSTRPRGYNVWAPVHYSKQKELAGKSITYLKMISHIQGSLWAFPSHVWLWGANSPSCSTFVATSFLPAVQLVRRTFFMVRKKKGTDSTKKEFRGLNGKTCWIRMNEKKNIRWNSVEFSMNFTRDDFHLFVDLFFWSGGLRWAPLRGRLVRGGWSTSSWRWRGISPQDWRTPPTRWIYHHVWLWSATQGTVERGLSN